MKLLSQIARNFLIFSMLFGAILVLAPVAFASLYGRGVYGSCQYGSGCTLSLSTSGNVNLTLAPESGSKWSIAGDEVEVTTNSIDGYTLSLEMSSATVNALTDGAATLPAAAGTVDDPVALGNNEWGFRVDNLGDFGAGPTTAVTNSFYNDQLFAGVTLLGDPATIRTTNNDVPTGEITDVWYGIRATDSLTSGSYTGTVVYTAVTL